MYHLGWMYAYSYDVEKNEKKAVEWYTKSAGDGNEYAKQELEKLKKKNSVE